eukprot:2952748-Prymnesium_polylepis.1
MRGARWDEPKQLEIAKIKKMQAKIDVCADDASIKGIPVIDMMWTGRCKRNPDGTVLKDNARCVACGDQDSQAFGFDKNVTMAPVARHSTFLCTDAVCCLRGQDYCSWD